MNTGATTGSQHEEQRAEELRLLSESQPVMSEKKKLSDDAESTETVDDDCGPFRCEAIARRAELILEQHPAVWSLDESSPHISEFSYDVFANGHTDEDEGQPKRKLGVVSGYIIMEREELPSAGIDDLPNESLWSQADAIDADILNYVVSLTRELNAASLVCGHGPRHEFYERALIIKYVEAVDGEDATDLLVKVTATLVMKEGPRYVLVDPETRIDALQRSKAGKRRTREKTAAVLKLGLVRMVMAPYVWGWAAGSDWLTFEYSYEDLVIAKAKGKLDKLDESEDPEEE